VDDREVEGVGEVDETSQLVGRRRGQAAAIDFRFGGEHGDRVAVESGEGGDQARPEVTAELEHRPGVEDGGENPPHVVGLPPVARDGAEQPLVAPPRVIARFRARRHLPDAGR